MAVQIVAERPETLELLRRHIDILATELRQQGFTDLSFTFGQGGASGDGRQAADPRGDQMVQAATETLVANPPEQGRSRGAGRLDLRI